jgi:phosphatidylglycerophosphatase A
MFRVFDIIKPYPAGWIDRKVDGGYGIVLDDVAAGIYANVVLQIFRLMI